LWVFKRRVSLKDTADICLRIHVGNFRLQYISSVPVVDSLRRKAMIALLRFELLHRDYRDEA
jgi:hypothetical protein